MLFEVSKLFLTGVDRHTHNFYELHCFTNGLSAFLDNSSVGLNLFE